MSDPDTCSPSTAYRYDEDPPHPSPIGSVELADVTLHRAVEDFLFYEADLLDQWRYESWTSLLSDDVRYWMPIRRNVRFGSWEREQSKELADLAWFDENKTTILMRVKQLMSGVHWAEEPLSRISHLITNVRIIDTTGVAGSRVVTVRDRFHVYRNRVDDEVTNLVGKRETELREMAGSFLISRRSIFLDQSVLLSKNLTYFL